MDNLANEPLIPAMNAVLAERCIIDAWTSLLLKYYQIVTTVLFNYYCAQWNMKDLDKRHKFPSLPLSRRVKQQQPPPSRLCLDWEVQSVCTRHRELAALSQHTPSNKCQRLSPSLSLISFENCFHTQTLLLQIFMKTQCLGSLFGKYGTSIKRITVLYNKSFMLCY